MDANARADFVERFARLFESQGQTRIAGRIYAHLATDERPYLGLQELADELGVSRASVSVNTRWLITNGLLERVPVPGARGDHYGVTPDGLAPLFAAAAQQVRALAEIAQEGVALQPRRATRGTASLRAMSATYFELATALESVVRTRKAAR